MGSKPKVEHCLFTRNNDGESCTCRHHAPGVSAQECRPISNANKLLSNADASVENPQDGQRYFAKPFECQQPFRQFIDRVQAQGLRYQGSPVMYSQARRSLGTDSMHYNALTRHRQKMTTYGKSMPKSIQTSCLTSFGLLRHCKGVLMLSICG